MEIGSKYELSLAHYKLLGYDREMRVVIVIGVYNEAESTPKMIEALAAVVPHIKNHDVHILYVDGNSPDGTADIIRKYQQKYKWIHLIVEKEKNGLGAAYAIGMTYAMKELKADYIGEMDGDLQHPPAVLKELISQIDRGYDFIIASRYIKGGAIPKDWGLNRKFLSVVGNLVARVLLILPQVHDVTGGFKLSKVAGFMGDFDFKTLLSKRFAYKVHLLFYMIQKGAKVKEVPFVFAPRNADESKIGKNDLQETLRVIFLLQLHNPKIRKFAKFATVGVIGFFVNSVALEIFSNSTIPTTVSKNFLFLDKYPILTLFAHEPAWAGAFSAEFAIISNFIMNNFWTFKEQKANTVISFIRKLLKFNLTSFGAVLIQFTVIGTATRIFGDIALVRQIALIVSIGFFIIPYNWFMYNKVIWKKRG